MRVAIISDIHGNQIALDAVLDNLKRQPAVDQIVIAGDICLNGPRPAEVLGRVKDLHCPVIQGNVDVEVVTEAPDKGAKKKAVIAWTREQIGLEGILYLDNLPASYRIVNPQGDDALVVHANPHNQEDALFPSSPDDVLEGLLGDLEANISALAFGHLHIAYVRHWRRLLLFDVGSCGLPRDEDRRASYGILTWQDNVWQAEIHRVEYDLEAVVAQLHDSNMPFVEKRIKILTRARY